MPVINPSVVDSWSELAKVKPSAAGDIITLQSYYAGNKYGGGDFVARAGSPADDGGTICRVTDANFYWERMIQDANKLDVTHFGAVNDGKTDCAAACLRMIAWCDKKGAPYSNIGCQFPAGNFSIGNIDLSAKERGMFRFVGAPVVFGYFGTTRLYLDGTKVVDEKTGEMVPALLVNARKTEIAHFIINGRTDRTPNKRGFFRNVTAGGEFVHASYWRAEYVGGIMFDILDTLDTRFEEFYATSCSDTIIRNRWTGATWGNWQHTTAVELSNFNIQKQTGENPALDIPKCTQSFIKNGWIEHCYHPGSITDGQWLIDGLSIEGCTLPFDLTHNRTIMRGINLQSGSSIEYNNPNVPNSQPYERGRLHQENYGTRQFGSMAYNYLHSNIRFKNDTDKPVWICVGNWQVVDPNDMTIFRVMGASGTVGGEGSISPFGSDNFGGGELEMSLRRNPVKDHRQEGAVTVRGKSPVLDIAVTRAWDNDITVYIQLPANCGWVNCYLETSGHSRFTNGTPFHWTYKGDIVSDEDFKKLGTARPRNATALGTLTHGLAIMEDGVLNLQTREVTADGKLVLNLNGIYHVVPVEKAAYASDKFLRNAPLSGRSLDNGLGGLFDFKWGNWGVNGGAYSKEGVCYLNQKFKCSVGVSTTLSDVEVEFKVLAGPSNIDGKMGVSVELRRSNWNPDQTAYVLGFMGKDSDGFNKLALFRRVAAADKSFVLTQLDTVAMRMSDNQTLKVSAKGGMIKVFANNVLIGTAEEAEEVAIKTGTVVAFGMWEGNTGITLNDFKVSQAS